MLRNAVREQHPKSFVRAFSTWLDVHHLSPFAPDALQNGSGPSSALNEPRRFASTRAVQKTPTKLTEPPLPRFLRRELMRKDADKAKISPSKTTAKRPAPSETQSAFRSRHYDPSTETPKSELRLLEPHVLSARLKKLCDAGKIDDAVYMLKNAPLDAQNTPVWNTMIWETLKAKRYQLAYQLYVDMKRRGFSPTTRTFQTFFTGLSKIEHWPTHTKQLKNARSLYEAYQRHIASLKRHDPEHPEISVDPLAGYIRVLGSAGCYQEIFDVYYALDQDGRLAPNHYVFTAMFQAIVVAKGDTTEGSVKVAADARMLWSQMIKVSNKTKTFTPDSHVVAAALTALAGGNKPDHDLAFGLINEYFGLEVDKPVSRSGKFPLQAESLAVILRFCNLSKHHAQARQFLQQVRRRPGEIGGASILDRAHMEEVLRAELALAEPGLGYHAVETLEWMLRQEITGTNGPKIRPALSTYNLVMQGCWRSADWVSATRAFDLMTGYHAHDFMDGSVAEEPRFDKRGPGRNLPANAEFMSSFVKAALATKNRANIRQVLRIVDHLGFEDIVASAGTERQETSKTVKDRMFYGTKFATALVEAVDTVLEEGGKFARPEEAKKWKALVKQAQTHLRELGLPQPARTSSKATKRTEVDGPPPRRTN